MIQFIDDNRDRFGVEPICRVLTEHQVKIAPSSYYAFKCRPASARATSDAELSRKLSGCSGTVSSAAGSVVLAKSGDCCTAKGLSLPGARLSG